MTDAETHAEVIIVEENRTETVSVTADRDDATSITNLWQQQVRKEEVTNVIRAELQFNAFGRQRIRRHHDARIVHQNINLLNITPAFDRIDGRTNRLLARQIQGNGLHGDVLRRDGFDDRGDFGWVAGRQDQERRRVRGQCCGEVSAQTVGGDAGDEDCLVGDLRGEGVGGLDCASGGGEGGVGERHCCCCFGLAILVAVWRMLILVVVKMKL